MKSFLLSLFILFSCSHIALAENEDIMCPEYNNEQILSLGKVLALEEVVKIIDFQKRNRGGLESLKNYLEQNAQDIRKALAVSKEAIAAAKVSAEDSANLAGGYICPEYNNEQILSLGRALALEEVVKFIDFEKQNIRPGRGVGLEMLKNYLEQNAQDIRKALAFSEAAIAAAKVSVKAAIKISAEDSANLAEKCKAFVVSSN